MAAITPENKAASQPPSGSRLNGLYWLICLLSFVLLLAMAAAFGVWSVYQYARQPGPLANAETRLVLIPPHSSFKQIKSILVGSDIIADDIRFDLIARLTKKARRLRAGEYLFVGPVSPLAVLGDLEAGRIYLHAITIPEGANIYQVAEILHNGGWSTTEQALERLQNPAYANSLGIAAGTLEGYLFPDTYYFPRGEAIDDILRIAYQRFRQVYTEECRKKTERYFEYDCQILGNDENIKEHSTSRPRLSGHEIVTLASIVEKETGGDGERPLVASVFLNRLQKGMRLQADPTVVYGLQKFGQALTRKDLQKTNPYNTYTESGLPPGPICNPGRESLRAVFQAPDDSYLYFVLQEDGKHYFSSTLAEHNRAVRRYRQAKKEEKNREKTLN